MTEAIFVDAADGRRRAAVWLALIDGAQRRVHARAPRWSGATLAQVPMIMGFTVLLSDDHGADVPSWASAVIAVLWIAGVIGGLVLGPY